LARPREWRLPASYGAARLAGAAAAWSRRVRRPAPAEPVAPDRMPAGISVVVPSRNGRELLDCLLPGLARELDPHVSEIIVVDNGSSDGTEEHLRARYPRAMVERSPEPLSFARAVNRGLRRARYSRVCLLNNDMVLAPGFFAPLLRAFETVPDLFCATAQILFPAGVRREETGKAVVSATPGRREFPVRCDEPLPGEDGTYVLYGSGGCSLYCTARLRALGGLSERYEPAYVEDLDAGFRAWQRGWPTVFVAGARVEHRHRSTTARYYSSEQLQAMVEINYLRFIAGAVADPEVFSRLWSHAAGRLRLLAAEGDAAARAALSYARRAPLECEAPAPRCLTDTSVLALGSGELAVFPGRAGRANPAVVIASPYLPFPLSHGGAVRIYNLMRRAAAEYDQVLVAFCDRLEAPPPELLEITAEVVLVRRAGSHSLPSRGRPDVVEEFASPVFRAALGQAIRKWGPAIAQLEFTQMAQYASDCAPARTVLVEHDITFDLYEQLARESGDWEQRRQHALWRSFETAAWRGVDRVVTMSEKDRGAVRGAVAVALPNGVDLERFRPAEREPEPGRLLFIGSFAHLPNLLAVHFFLERVWPRLRGATLHIIAGSRPEYHLERCRDRVRVDLERPGIELEAFVADVRPAYERAAVVIAPLVASAGTNIKILEAMAMGKAIVSTAAGVNGLDLVSGEDLVVASGPEEMARAIQALLEDPAARMRLERQARARVERDFGWDAIAARQTRLYRSLSSMSAGKSSRVAPAGK
jgi:glycosyltransferase involved in cell wall biosynthesis/GT2 family glycosyltransferase